MIIKANEKLRTTVMNYVSKEPAINLFIIGDIEQFGFDNDFQEVFLQYSNDEITACVLRYYKNMIVYSDSDFDISEIILLLNTMNFSHMSGKKTVMDLLIPYLNNIKDIKECYFCELNNGEKLERKELIHKIANKDDIDKLHQLMIMAGFATETYKESAKRRLENKAGRIYFIETNGVAISSASTSIEASVAAMIGGVATHVDYRNRGLASQLVSILSSDLLKEGKKPCLFFYNPKAGSIYHRLGFTDIDMWTVINLNE